MAKSIMHMQKVSWIVKSEDFTSVFSICKFCAVVSIGKPKAVSFFTSSSVLSYLFYSVRILAVIVVMHFTFINITDLLEQTGCCIGICGLGIINICDRCKTSVGICKRLAFLIWSCYLYQMICFSCTVRIISQCCHTACTVCDGCNTQVGIFQAKCISMSVWNRA